MAKKYEELANSIVELVGGKENIVTFVHCVTRLRFNIKDKSKVKEEEIKKIKDVVGTNWVSDQFQIIIGPGVDEAYNLICKTNGLEVLVAVDANDKGNKKLSVSAFFEGLSGIFVPIIPAIAASGVLKAFLSLATLMGFLSSESQTYYIINFAADATFYFLPMLLAYSSAQKFKCSPALAILVAGIMLHPNFSALVSAGETVKLFGLPVTLVKYQSSVVPIILSTWALSYVEKFFNKILHKSIRMVFSPLLTILVMLPVTLIVIGPLGTWMGDLIVSFILFMDDKLPWVIPTLLGTLSPLMVLTGMHYSLAPALVTQMSLYNYNTIVPGMFSSNMAQGVAGLIVGLMTKKSEERELGLSTGVTAILGITEPVLYGITLKYKKILYAVMAGGGLGGLFYGLTKVKCFSTSGAKIFLFSVYISGEYPSNFMLWLIGFGITVVATAIFTFIAMKSINKETQNN